MEKTSLERKIVLFDLDNTLLQEDFLNGCASRFNFSQAHTLLRQMDYDALQIFTRAALFMRGRTIDELTSIARATPLMENANDVVSELKSRSCIVGLISFGYQLMADEIGKRINADIVLANELKTENNSITGAFAISSHFSQNSISTCGHKVCKTNALHFLSKKYETSLSKCIVVSDVKRKDCLVTHAGLTLPFQNANDLLAKVLIPF